MAMKRSGAGGGINSNKHVSPPVKYGQPAQRKRHEGVSRIGQSVGNRATGMTGEMPNYEPVKGGTIAGPLNVPLGNEVAMNVGKGGPGTGRKIMPSGSQGCS